MSEVTSQGPASATEPTESVNSARVVAALIGLAVLAVLSAELAVLIGGTSVRWAAYEGGIGAWVAALSGLPFSLKLASLPKVQDGQFWQLWGFGLAARTSVGLLVALVIVYGGPADVSTRAGVLVLVALHFVALMVETAWLSTRLTQANIKK